MNTNTNTTEAFVLHRATFIVLAVYAVQRNSHGERHVDIEWLEPRTRAYLTGDGAARHRPERRRATRHSVCERPVRRERALREAFPSRPRRRSARRERAARPDRSDAASHQHASADRERPARADQAHALRPDHDAASTTVTSSASSLPRCRNSSSPKPCASCPAMRSGQGPTTAPRPATPRSGSCDGT